eukprot:CAMPEP_0113626948 /NCGR_PEP_ID=MMETSP0017_2-20120614/13946_1 /TAXON_ID=2856 /ORGANISM="Cylindrotheca closterium" /LENGTH=87 /DNA_ID=CAMNT_0000537165 /DNA_START=122 /DNA_END=385 /DNA_ORIENTATION=- /assembly_acc=CAM_ASM_000147
MRILRGIARARGSMMRGRSSMLPNSKSATNNASSSRISSLARNNARSQAQKFTRALSTFDLSMLSNNLVEGPGICALEFSEEDDDGT